MEESIIQKYVTYNFNTSKINRQKEEKSIIKKVNFRPDALGFRSVKLAQEDQLLYW